MGNIPKSRLERRLADYSICLKTVEEKLLTDSVPKLYHRPYLMLYLFFICQIWQIYSTSALKLTEIYHVQICSLQKLLTFHSEYQQNKQFDEG